MTKNTLLVLLGLLVSASLLTAFWYFYHKKEGALPETTSPQIMLYRESGDVSFKAQTENDFTLLTAPSIPITSMTLVKTGEGKASVLLPDNSLITLDANTQIVVTYTPTKTSIYQLFGRTYHRVEKVLSGGTYEVETSGTLATVRGTKFAVINEKGSATTTVAVTEHSVAVSPLIRDQTGSTTPATPVLVEEGKQARVSATSVPEVTNVEESLSKEDTAWITEERTRDDIFDEVKRTSPTKEEMRQEVEKKVLQDQDPKKEEPSPVETKESDTVVKDTTPVEDKSVKKEPETTKIVVPTKKDIKVTQEETKKVVDLVKIDEETFFTAFSDMFITYFYLDETDSACRVAKNAKERTAEVTSYAEKSGYPFTSTTLLSFGEAIDDYCKNPDKRIKTSLQGRFDVEFPFND